MNEQTITPAQAHARARAAVQCDSSAVAALIAAIRDSSDSHAAALLYGLMAAAQVDLADTIEGELLELDEAYDDSAEGAAGWVADRYGTHAVV